MKYEVGKRINEKWIIVSILYSKKQNKKILCYNPEHNLFKEGWIWDFTRDIVSYNKNKMSECKEICTKLNTKNDLDIIINNHFEYSNKVYYKTNYLTREEYSILRDWREGWIHSINHILKKFDFLLSNDYTKNGQSRRNKNLSNLIIYTYLFLYINEKI
jgi:hypothetical protein